MHMPTILAALSLSIATVAAAQSNVMFVTSASGLGDLSTWPEADGLRGIAAGNRICQNLAAAAHLANAATFQAWLSDRDTDAACNIKARSGHPPGCGSFAVNNPGPWARTDGTPFARNVTALTAGEVLSPPRYNENGAEMANRVAWTGTDDSGRLVTHGNCEDINGIGWSGFDSAFAAAAGRTDYGTSRWTFDTSIRCDQMARLYCFQHSIFGGAPFPPFERDGALVFLTSRAYPAALGLSPDAGGEVGILAGDAICQQRATAGGLPDPAGFRAWLSTSQVDAADRLVYDGPFKRPDGVELASSRADLLDGELLVPASETELLGYRSDFVWTGTSDDGTLFAPDRACTDWTSDEPGLEAVVGASSGVTAWTLASLRRNCGVPAPLYCIAQAPVLFWTNFEESGGLWRWAGTAP